MFRWERIEWKYFTYRTWQGWLTPRPSFWNLCVCDYGKVILLYKNKYEKVCISEHQERLVNINWFLMSNEKKKMLICCFKSNLLPLFGVVLQCVVRTGESAAVEEKAADHGARSPLAGQSMSDDDILVIF